MAKQAMQMDKKLFSKVYWRYVTLGSCAFSQTKMMTAGFCRAITPWLKALYPDNQEKFTEAMVRHQPFFNCTPETACFIFGLVCSMEGEYAADPENFDPASISAIKAALMGPLSGVGDAIMWVAVRTISASIAINLAQNGSIIAPFAFVIVYHIFSTPVRWFAMKYGYTLGNKFLENAYESGYVDMLTMGATIIGLIMVGAMCANFVKFPVTLMLSDSQSLQAVLDSIVPGLLPLVVCLLTLRGVRKGMSIGLIIVIMLVIGIVCALVGVYSSAA